MYKAITSFWSKPTSSTKTQLSSDKPIDEDSWVFVSDTVIPSSIKSNNSMTNSWIEPLSIQKTDELQTHVHHFNPIENLLIEHASMSVYEQIASKTRNRRQKKFVNDYKLDEQIEDVEEQDDDDDDDDDRTSMNHHPPNLTSIHPRNINISTNSFITTVESSTLSLTAHHRHLQRSHQRRKRSNKSSSSSKLILPNTIDESKQEFNENLELHHVYTHKIHLQQTSHSNN
ncbi:unnamed protein product [Rotaria sp. Silwood1]|nr:unnamed protein product [Rotaria sp. Silwood1]CAF1578907.1 unnamed protein product [Rotaria sp. Silwood1]CAF3851383.1 unnamed protein product [Rotaria sp. Silwood1]CAF4736458.1 unnamed protein product [Rotaria sp. Silwood1]